MKRTKLQPWIHGRVPNGYWDSRENRVEYMEWLGQRLGFTSHGCWYRVTKLDFKQNYGGGLLNSQFRDSIVEAVHDYRPDLDWIPWMFIRTPRGFWDITENRISYLLWLEERAGIDDPEGWYSVTKRTFGDHHGRGILRIAYGDSVCAAVRELYPDFDLKPWLFAETPQSYWQSPDNHRHYMSWLATRLGYSAPEDWYAVTQECFNRHKGRGLLATQYNDSPQEAVMTFLPDAELLPWRFASVRQRFWQLASNRTAYLRWLGNEQGFLLQSDWDQLTADRIKVHDGAGLLSFYRSRRTYDFRIVESNIPAKRQTTIWKHICAVELALTGRDAAEMIREVSHHNGGRGSKPAASVS